MTLRILFVLSCLVSLLVAPVMLYGVVRWFLITYSDAPATGSTIAAVSVVVIAELAYLFGFGVWINAWISQRER